jgi:hypothetical protein
MSQAGPAQQVGSERVQSEPGRGGAAPVEEGQQRRQQQEHGYHQQQDSGSGEEAEFGQTLEVRDQKCIEGGGGREGAQNHPDPGVAPDRVDGFVMARPAVSLLHVAAVQHDDEVDAEADQQASRRGGERVEATEGQRHECDGKPEPGHQRQERIREGRRTAERQQEQQHDSDERGHHADSGIAGDELTVGQCDDVATREIDHRRRTLPALCSPGGLYLAHPLGEAGCQPPVEDDVLGRFNRSGHHQQHPPIGIDQTTGLRVDGDTDATEPDPGENARKEPHRIDADELLRDQALRRQKLCLNPTHLVFQGGLIEPTQEFVQLARGEKQSGATEQRYCGVGAALDSILHPIDELPLAKRSRQPLAEGEHRLEIFARGETHHHQQRVHRSEPLDRGLEVLNDRVVGGYQGQNVGVDSNPGRSKRRQQPPDDRDQHNGPRQASADTHEMQRQGSRQQASAHAYSSGCATTRQFCQK